MNVWTHTHMHTHMYTQTQDKKPNIPPSGTIAFWLTESVIKVCKGTYIKGIYIF